MSKIRTKADLSSCNLGPNPAVSTVTGDGLPDLVSIIHARALSGADSGYAMGIGANVRQVDALRGARLALCRAVDHPGYTLDLRAEELRIAATIWTALSGGFTMTPFSAVFSRVSV